MDSNVRVTEDDAVFKARPTDRGGRSDRLRERNGQTLGELCEPLDMARQSATRIWACWRRPTSSPPSAGAGRSARPNPVPLWDITERWIERFECPRLRALSAIKHRAEEDTMADRPSYVYATYIESTPERVWEALTDADLSARYWGHSNVSDTGRQARRRGSYRRSYGSGIADVAYPRRESTPPQRLAMAARSRPGGVTPPQGPSPVTFDIEPYHETSGSPSRTQNVADDVLR